MKKSSQLIIAAVALAGFLAVSSFAGNKEGCCPAGAQVVAKASCDAKKDCADKAKVCDLGKKECSEKSKEACLEQKACTEAKTSAGATKKS